APSPATSSTPRISAHCALCCGARSAATLKRLRSAGSGPPERRRGRSRRRSLPRGLQVQRHRSLADLASEHEPVLAGAAEMDAGIDARVGALPSRLREAREGPRDPVEGLAARDGEVGLIAAEGTGEDDRGRAAE